MPGLGKRIIGCDVTNFEIGNHSRSVDPTSVYYPDIGVFPTSGIPDIGDYPISEYALISEFTRYRVYSDIRYFQKHTRYRVQYRDILMSGTLTPISEFAKNPDGRRHAAARPAAEVPQGTSNSISKVERSYFAHGTILNPNFLHI
jgi:hypothetical protein